MSSQDFTPWWKRVNDYISFEERKEFTQGANGLRPNLPLNVMMGMLSSGYVNDSFEKPRSYTGKSSETRLL
jgi:hypothetical protein